MQKWIIIVIVFFIIVIGGIVVFNFNIDTEYVPETEIEDKELRKTVINLYFQDKESKDLVKESILIDSKNLLREPYMELLNMLLKGPEGDNYEKTIPEGTKINEIVLVEDVITINFSSEFVENSKDEKQRYNSIYSIVKTLTEFKEINGIKIIIEGKEIDGFTEIGLDFKKIFKLKDFEK